MGEIKYQAFIKEVGECFEVEYLHIVSEEVEVRLHPKGITQLFSYSKENEKAILRQYTGLKDKNGKEIYEGDVVTEKYGNEYGVGKVVFEDGAFWVHFLDDEYLLIGCDSEQTEVIGNIYENPELLNS